MKIATSGFINSSKSILLAEDIEEVFFEVYNILYNGEKFVVEGSYDADNKEINATLAIDGYGVIPVSIKKDIHNKHTGLYLAEHLKREDSPYDDVPKEILQSIYDDNDIILAEKADDNEIISIDVDIVESEKRSKQQALFYENLNNIVNEQTKTAVYSLTESMYEYVKNKIAEHSSTLLSEYLSSIEKAKPQLEQYIYDVISLNGKDIDKSFTEKVNAIDNKINIKVRDLEKFKQSLTNQITEKADESQTLIEKLISESTSRALEEIRSSILNSKTDIDTWLKEAKEEIKSNNDINFTTAIDEVKKLTESHLSTISNLQEDTKRDIINENEKYFQLFKQEKQGLQENIASNIQLVQEEKNHLISIHSEQLASMKSTFFDAEQSLKNMFQTLSENVTQTVKSDISDSFKTQLNEARKTAKDTELLKRDIKGIKTQLDSQFVQLRRYIESFGGGGSVAVQYAAGGTMNGNLDITGNLEANAISIQNVTFTNDLSTNVTSITAMPEFLKIQVNGVDRYVRLFTVV